MARDIVKKTKRFSLEESDAIEENERILEAGSKQRKENRENDKEKKAETTSAATPSMEVPAMAAHAAIPSTRKSTNGIVVDVPIDDYMALMQMKIMTRRTLKDLALQAIHEFVERNK